MNNDYIPLPSVEFTELCHKYDFTVEVTKQLSVHSAQFVVKENHQSFDNLLFINDNCMIGKYRIFYITKNKSQYEINYIKRDE